MKVLLVVTGLPDATGPGRSAFNRVFVNELTNLGVEVTLVHARSINPSRELVSKRLMDGIECYTISAFVPPLPCIGGPIFISRLFEQSFKRLDLAFDVVHAVGGGAAIAASIAADFKGKPLILQFIGDDVNTRLKNSLKDYRFLNAVFTSTCLCFNSNKLLETFRTLVPLTQKCEVVYRGVRPEEFKSIHADAEEVRLLFLGGIPSGNEKGALTLVKAIQCLDKADLPTRLNFVIGGPRSLTLVSRIKVRNPRLRTTFVGEIDRKSVIEELESSHIVLIPSLNEGVPNLLFEAMASGNMVIASDVGGIPEVLAHGVSGILVKPGDHVMLAESIMDAISDKQKIRDFSESGRQIVEKFDYRNFSSAYIRIYKQISK